METRWKKQTALFLSGQTLSLFGSSIVQFGITWYVTLTTQNGMMMTLITLCGFLPQAVISLFAGVWADRYSRKNLIILADAVIASCTAVLAVLWAVGYQEMWLIFFISAVRSFGAGIQEPAVGALLPDLVPQERLLRVNGLRSTIQSLMFLLSPVVAGVLYDSWGIGPMFWVDVVTAALGIGLMLRLRVPAKEALAPENALAEKPRLLGDMVVGLRYIRQTPWLYQMLMFYLFYALMFGPLVFLTPLMVARSFGDSPNLLVMHEMVFSIGALGGGALISLWGGFRNKVHTMLAACIFLGAATTALGFSTSFPFYLVMMGCTGLTMPLINTGATTVMQTRVEPELIGRVFGLMTIIGSTAMPLSMVFFGPLADVVSIEVLLIGSGLVMTLIALLALGGKQFIAAGEPQHHSP